MAQFVDRFKQRVFRLCYFMVGHHQDAEDMTQETFVRALRSLDRFDRTRSLEPWLVTIAANRCRTLLRGRGRRPGVEPLSHEVASEQALPGGDGLAEEVRQALLCLRAEYREAFLLFHDHEMSYPEIADAMEVPLGTVKTWIHRARRELVERLLARGVLEESSDGLPRLSSAR